MAEPLQGTAHPRRVVLAATSLVLAAAIGALGLSVGQHVSLSLLYVVPIGMMAWWVGRVSAVLLSVACAGDWLLIGGLRHPDLAFGLPLWNSFVELGFFTIISLSLAALRCSLEHQRALATTDDVTGAPNRRAFYERATLELSRLRRTGAPLTLAFLDLDAFKGVNDRFGHRVGDELLRTVASTLAKSLRSVDFVSRLGGDEFAVLLPETDEEAARTVLEKIREELDDAFVRGGWPVTSSAGAATFLTTPASIDAALAEADALLYLVKARGKNGVAHRTLGPESRSSIAGPLEAPHTAG